MSQATVEPSRRGILELGGLRGSGRGRNFDNNRSWSSSKEKKVATHRLLYPATASRSATMPDNWQLWNVTAITSDDFKSARPRHGASAAIFDVAAVTYRRFQGWK